MKSIHKVIIAATFSAGWLVSASPSLADAPDLRLTWRSLGELNVNECLNRSVQAMKEQGLQRVEAKDGEFVQGVTRNSQAKIMCVRHEGETLAVIAVSSDSQSEARDIRQGLRDRLRSR